MIQSHELRIGNHVTVNGERGAVVMINEKAVTLIKSSEEGLDEGTTYDLESIGPVPLTDDILKACGFIYHEYFKYWQLISGTGPARSEMDIDRDYDVIDFLRRPIIKKVNSLHHLQNIFFTLKGKELVPDQEPAL
ncbi:MAG TPA: hypothetical protein VHK91_01440 [Flavisolibacter sp.]|jgi:hypothetical protein|nr:hypothetical protein [Flavisolibacter sp.]